MIKKIILSTIFCLMLLGNYSAAETVLLYGSYSENKITIDFNSSIETGDFSEFTFTEWNNPDTSVKVSEYRMEEPNRGTFYAENLLSGKKYILNGSCIFLNGTFYSNYDFDVIVQLSGDGLDVHMSKANIIDSKTFEVCFNHPVDGVKICNEALELYEDGQPISTQYDSNVEFVGDIVREKRLVCRLKEDITFEGGKEYSLRIPGHTEMSDGAVVESEYIEVFMYKTTNAQDVKIKSAEYLRDDVIKVEFTQEMTSNFMPELFTTDGETVSVVNRRWCLDEDERQTILILYLKKPEIEKTYLLKSVNTLYRGEAYEGILSVTDGVMEIEIVDITLLDPTNMKIKLNKVIKEESLASMDVIWMSNHPVEDVALDRTLCDNTSSTLHIVLSLSDAVGRNSTRTICLKGDYTDEFGVEHEVDIQVEKKFTDIPQYKVTVKQAYFRDQHNIIMEFSHPVPETVDQSFFKVTEVVGDHRRNVGIEAVDIQDRFSVRLQLVNGSNMNDAKVTVRDLKVQGGIFSADGVYDVTLKRY